MSTPSLYLGQGNNINNSNPYQTPSSYPPKGFDPYTQGGRVGARWTMPYQAYQTPLLELPQNKSMRISLCVNAFLGDPIINSAAKLTIYMAFETLLLTVTSHCKKIPTWIPKEEVQRYIDDYGEDKPQQIAAAYVKQKCLEFLEYTDIKSFFEGEALDMVVSGDGFVNIASNALPAEEQEIWNAPAAPGNAPTIKAVENLKKKMLQDGRGAYNIYALQSLNPSAVWLYPDYAGRITNAKVVHLLGEGVWDLNLENLIHLKAPASWNWVIYGISHYLSALKWVDIKFKMMDALYTNASRYVTPREWLKIRGPEATENKAALPPTEEQMSWAAEIMGAYSSGVPFVLPDGWEWQYLGAEGKVLRIETLLEKIDDAIRTAAQVSRTFTSGAANVPAYATSKLQAGVMYKAIAPLASIVARAVEGRLLQRFCVFNGFFEEDGTLIAPKVGFKAMPIQGDDSVEKKITALGTLGWLSPITAWEFEGIDPNLEMERIAMAKAGLVEPFRAIAPDLSPSQSPDRFDELREDIEEKLSMLGVAHAKGQKKLMRTVAEVMYHEGVGDWGSAEEATEAMNKYLVQAHYLQKNQKSDAQNLLDTDMPWEDQVYRMKKDDDAMKDTKNSEVAKCAVVIGEVKNKSMKHNGSVNGTVTV